MNNYFQVKYKYCRCLIRLLLCAFKDDLDVNFYEFFLSSKSDFHSNLTQNTIHCLQTIKQTNMIIVDNLKSNANVMKTYIHNPSYNNAIFIRSNTEDRLVNTCHVLFSIEKDVSECL